MGYPGKPQSTATPVSTSQSQLTTAELLTSVTAENKTRYSSNTTNDYLVTIQKDTITDGIVIQRNSLGQPSLVAGADVWWQTDQANGTQQIGDIWVRNDTVVAASVGDQIVVTPTGVANVYQVDKESQKLDAEKKFIDILGDVTIDASHNLAALEVTTASDVMITMSNAAPQGFTVVNRGDATSAGTVSVRSGAKVYELSLGQMLVVEPTASGDFFNFYRLDPAAFIDLSNNLALDAGSTYSASSAVSGKDASKAFNGDLTTANNWWEATSTALSQYLQVDFDSTYAIDSVALVSIQDNLSSTTIPDENMTGSSRVLTGFDFEYWDGSAWQNYASVSGNNKVKRVESNPANITTDKIRVTNMTTPNLLRIVELEVWERLT